MVSETTVSVSAEVSIKDVFDCEIILEEELGNILTEAAQNPEVFHHVDINVLRTFFDSLNSFLVECGDRRAQKSKKEIAMELLGLLGLDDNE